MLMTFLKNVSYKNVIIYRRSTWVEPHLSSSLFSINYLFSNIANILYAIFNNVIGL